MLARTAPPVEAAADNLTSLNETIPGRDRSRRKPACLWYDKPGNLRLPFPKRRAPRYICTTEASSNTAPGGFSPIRTVVSLTNRYGGTGRLYGAGTPA
jgi:hypothetical protein